MNVAVQITIKWKYYYKCIVRLFVSIYIAHEIGTWLVDGTV